MLVVTLRSGEAVRLTDRRTNEITRLVVGSGGPVRLAIDAPGDVHILREELLARDSRDASQHDATGHGWPLTTGSLCRVSL
jgi:sRNA-binding carbon storage regulator CsrA